MTLSILIVNWNTRDLVIKCINSILRNLPSFDFEIVVVDNASKDGSADSLTHLYGHNRRVKIFQSLRNLGFAKGCNLAYFYSQGEYVMLLNPDTEVIDNSLERLVNYLEERSEIGVIGPRLLNPDGTLQHSVRRFPGIFSSLVVFSGLHRIFQPRRYLMADFDYSREAEVDQVMGAALLTRRKIIERIGFLDEKFWLWYEEVDFCKRVKDAGYKVVFYPKAQIMHIQGQSFSQMEIYFRKRTVARSLIHYFRKHGNRMDVIMIELLLPVVLGIAKFLDYLRRFFGVKVKLRT